MLKRTFFLLVIFFSTFCFSQKETFIGLESGISISTLRGNVVSDLNKSVINYFPSITFEKSFSGKLSFKTGISYEIKGSKVTISNFDPVTLTFSEEAIKNQLDIISIPIFFKYRTRGKWSLFINAGPNISYILKSNGISVKDFDFGINTGIGFQANILNGCIYLEGRNCIGLLNISDVPFSSETELKTNSYYILLGYSHSI